MEVPEEFEIIDFPGGLYAVSAGFDQETNKEAMTAGVDSFLKEFGLVRNPSRPELGHVITAPNAAVLLGKEQMDYWFPICKEDLCTKEC